MLGLDKGIAGIMRPLFGPVGTALDVNTAISGAVGAGGASAAATSGFDSAGGEGAFCIVGGGTGVEVVLGSLTVAVGFSGEACSTADDDPPVMADPVEMAAGIEA